MKSRVSVFTAVAMVSVAVLFDLSQFFVSLAIPFIGFIASAAIGIVAALLFGLWFILLGVNYFGGKKAHLKILAVLGAPVVELVPVFDMLPAITAGVLVIIFATWLEDKSNKHATLKQVGKLANIGQMKYARGRRGIENRFGSKED